MITRILALDPAAAMALWVVSATASAVACGLAALAVCWLGDRLGAR